MDIIITILVITGITACGVLAIALINYFMVKNYSNSIKLRYKDFLAIYKTSQYKWTFDEDNATYHADIVRYNIYFSPFEWLVRYIPFYINYKRGKTSIVEAETLEGFLINIQKDIDKFREKGIGMNDKNRRQR